MGVSIVSFVSLSFKYKTRVESITDIFSNNRENHHYNILARQKPYLFGFTIHYFSFPLLSVSACASSAHNSGQLCFPFGSRTKLGARLKRACHFLCCCAVLLFFFSLSNRIIIPL